MLRIIVSILLGAGVAFARFVLMAKLIENSSRPADEVPPAPVIDIVMQEPDDQTQTRTRVPPPPPPPPAPPAPAHRSAAARRAAGSPDAPGYRPCGRRPTG